MVVIMAIIITVMNQKKSCNLTSISFVCWTYWDPFLKGSKTQSLQGIDRNGLSQNEINPSQF